MISILVQTRDNTQALDSHSSDEFNKSNRFNLAGRFLSLLAMDFEKTLLPLMFEA